MAKEFASRSLAAGLFRNSSSPSLPAIPVRRSEEAVLPHTSTSARPAGCKERCSHGSGPARGTGFSGVPMHSGCIGPSVPAVPAFAVPASGRTPSDVVVLDDDDNNGYNPGPSGTAAHPRRILGNCRAVNYKMNPLNNTNNNGISAYVSKED